MEKSLCLHSLSSRYQVSPLPAELSHSSSAPRTPAWLWPHVLSLEAPMVAMLWLAALAHVDDFTLMPGVLSGLGLATWLVYLTDRVLDAWNAPEGSLGIRHPFYQRWRWPLVLGVMPAVAGLLVWLGLWVIPVGLLAHSLAQVLPILLYLVLYSVTSLRARRWLLQGGILLMLIFVNALPLASGLRLSISVFLVTGTLLMTTLRWHEHMERFFRKDLAAGLLFAFGCTTWTRFHTMGSEGADTWMQLLLLALLFVSNLSVINARELFSEDIQRRAQANLRGALALIVFALLAMPLGYLSTSLLPLTLAVGVGLVGLEVLWWKRRDFSPETFRFLADIIVALPACGLLLT